MSNDDLFRGANCLGYALGRDQYTQLNKQGEEGGGDNIINFYKPSLMNDLRIVRAILKRYPQWKKSSRSKMVLGKVYIAFRYGDGDFHFMKRDMEGSWTHKPGWQDIQEISEDKVFADGWSRLPWNRNPYNSRIFIFELKE